MKIKYLLLLLFIAGLTNFGYSQLTLSTSIVSLPCSGESNGSLELTITGGTSPYSITWSTGGSSFATDVTSVSNLSAGTYIIDVSDSFGVTESDTINLVNANIYTIDTISDAPCYAANGSLKITPYGGTYQYYGYWKRMIWNPNLNTMVVDSEWADTSETKPDTLNFTVAYPKGTYILTVVDSNGCIMSPKSIEIKEPSSALTLQETHSHNICKYDSVGQISISSFGGTAPYSYAWSNGGASASLSKLLAGTYTVTVTDDHNCKISESIDIEEPFQDMIPITEVHDVSCRDNQDGYVLIDFIENSLPPYTYSWSNGESNNSIADLLADDYSVTITDANNCTYIDTFEVALNDVDCIIINNVITPDGNGKNDTWIIKNIDLYPDCDVKVIDRWGNAVFEQTGGYDNSWDATSDGNVLNSGDYYYIVNLNMGDYPPYTGPLKILK